jgi:UDP-sugar transporter A1/2/3
MSYVDAATYQILGNLKIVSTGLLSWLFLRKRLTMVQWYALVLLMCGAATSQIQGCGEGCNANGLSAPIQVSCT